MPEYQPETLADWYTYAMEMWKAHERETDVGKRNEYFEQFRVRSAPLKQVLQLFCRGDGTTSLWQLWKAAGGDTGFFIP